MKTWIDVAREIERRSNDFDGVRREKIRQIEELTHRRLIVYAVDFIDTSPLKAPVIRDEILIGPSDKDGFFETTQDLPENQPLDILVHSPGGSAEAVEGIVDVIRSRFNDIRFIVPHTAKSAATMLVLSGNHILMDVVSELGPIDPQMSFLRDGQLVRAPAQAIKDQFDAAYESIKKDPQRLPAWIPILRQYGPSLLIECENHIQLARELVEHWLGGYMFRGDPRGREKATKIAEFFSNHNNFRSHGRRVDLEDIKKRVPELVEGIIDLRVESTLRDLVRELYNAIIVTFNRTGSFKMFERSDGIALIRTIQVAQIRQRLSPLTPPPPSKAPDQHAS